MQKLPGQLRMRHFIPAGFVAVLAGSAVLAFVSPLGGLLFIVIAGAYIVADLGTSLDAARKFSGRGRLLLPIVLPLLHVSYGLGFVVGLVKWAPRWKKPEPTASPG
jgi:succinoglycan biosynthesis protein ExoA